MELTQFGNGNTAPDENRTGIVFIFFCIWSFVMLSRPQDMFPVLSPLRPALLTGILTVVVFLLNVRSLSGPNFFQERQVKYFMTLLLVMVLGIPTSLYSRLSFMMIFTEYINAIVFFFLFYKIVDSVKKLSVVILMGCLGSGLYSLYSITTGSLDSGRLSFGRMFDPNDLAYFALGFLPLNLIFISRDNPLWIRLACFSSFGVSMLMILLTGSRGGLLAFGVAVVLLLFSKTQAIKKSHKVVFFALCLVIVSLSPINTERYATIFSIHDDYNVKSETGRLEIWKIGARAMLSNPFTGVGVGCFGNAVGLDREKNNAISSRWQAAHNSLVEIGTETGVFGFVLFVILSWNVLGIMRMVKKAAKSDVLVKICEMGYVGFVALFISSLFLSQAYSLYWVYFVAISAVINQLLVKEQAFAGNQP